MILVLVVAVAAALYGIAQGGSLDRLAATQFRFVWLLLVGLVVQLGFGFWDPEWLSDAGELAVVLGSNAVVALFVLLNRHLPGMWLAGIGLALNIAVIAPNGAMPVLRSAAELTGGGTPTDFGLKHEALTDDTIFPWLADVIPLPGMQTLLSAGDVVLALGIGRLVNRRMVDETDEAGRT